MIDKAKIGFYYDTYDEMENVLSNNIFENRKRDYSHLTGEPVEMCKVKNLQTTFYLHSKYVRVTGSLIQFRHFSTPNKEYISPEYYSNNTLSDIRFVVDYLSTLFVKDSREIKITGLEFSLTTRVPETPFFYIDGLNSIQLKPFYYLPPPRNHSVPLEKYCPFSQYTVKCYNWGVWNKAKGYLNEVKGNFLRWEIPFRKMQKVKQLTGRRYITLADLPEKLLQRNMATFALQTLRNTDKQLIIDCSDLQPKEMILYRAGKDGKVWNDLKKHNVNTYKKVRADYLRLCKRIEGAGHNPYNDLENLLQSKFEYLMDN